MFHSKIKTLKELKAIVKTLKDKNKKIITTNGVFDILHLGHIRYLQKAKEIGGILIVAINSDSSVKQIKGPQRPINNQGARAKVLASLECVNYVTIFNETNPIKILSEIKPNFHVKGEDYTISQIIEKNIVEKHKGKIILMPLIKRYSTTNIINIIKKDITTLK